MTLVTQCSLLHLRGKNSFLDKINDKLTCTGGLKPSVGWGWAVSLFTRTKSRWNVPRSTCSIFLTYAWVQCLSFVGYMCVWRSVNIELTEKRQRLWLKHVCVISQTTFEIQILPTVTFSLHIPIGLLNLKNYMGSCHKDYLRRAIRKCPHASILRWFVESIILTFGFGPLSWNKHDVSLNAWSRFDQQLSEKTDMSSTQSNKTPRFRCSIKYLKLKVVLQIVCLVSVLLAPKLVFYISTNELLFTNFKDAAYSSRP